MTKKLTEAEVQLELLKCCEPENATPWTVVKWGKEIAIAGGGTVIWEHPQGEANENELDAKVLVHRVNKWNELYKLTQKLAKQVVDLNSAYERLLDDHRNLSDAAAPFLED